MGHWTNSTAQTLSAASGEVTVVNFDQVVHPGNQTALQDGIYDYAYHLNLQKPSGEIGPSRVTSVLAVRREGNTTDTIRESRSFVEIDTDGQVALSHTGRTPLSSGDRVLIRVNLDQLSQSGRLKTRLKQGQASLTLDLVGGVATSGNFAGTVFPTQPTTSGQQYYRTDLNEPFYFTGSKWFGLLRTDGCGRSGNQPPNAYLRRYNGQIMTASRGIFIPFDATISLLSWTKANSVVGDIQIHRNGIAIATINASDSGGGVNLDADFAANGILSVFWSSPNTTNQVQISIHYHRRG